MKTKLRIILTLFLAFTVQLSFAQQRTVTGNVSDDSGVPLIGATIVIEGTSTGVTTDFNGNYSINASQGEVLVISYVSYISQKVAVGSSDQIDITMTEDTTSLDEVVVMAYGSQTKKSIVGSVGVVDSSTISNQQVTSPLRAIQGTVPGVNIISQGGQPGNNPSIRIRGFGSINASQEPLIVLDGAAFNGNLNTISQDQIESITVLKDASSTSLYGSRGANGVIVITTKKGRSNSAPSITIRTQVGVSNPTVGLHDMIDADDNFKYTWEAMRNTNQYVTGQSAAVAAQNATNEIVDRFGYNPYNVANPVDTNGNLVTTNKLWETDWEGEVIRNDALRVNHNIGVSGGNEKTTYFMSFDYLDEQGPVIKSDFERVSTRLNLESNVNDWLKVGLNTSFSRSESANPDQTSGSVTQAISWIYGVSSVYPIYARDENGGLRIDNVGNKFYDLGGGDVVGQSVNAVRPARGGENILSSINYGKEKRRRTNYLGNAYAEFKISDALSFKTQLSYENYLFDSFSFDDDLFGFASGINGRVSQNRDITTTLNAVQSLNFTKAFGNHGVSVNLITEAYSFEFDSLGAQGTGFLSNVENLNGSTTPEGVSGNITKERLNSYMARAAYNYNQKYFLEGSFRRDGSSRFSQDTRWGNFFSVGGSWIVSNEEFLANNNAITYLKLRGSYGELGNNRGIGYFPYQALFSTGWNNEGNTGVLLSGVADPFISWEKTASSNVGVDFTLFNGALSGTVDYYSKESVDLIYDKPLPTSTGVSAITTNVGAVKNYGVEVALTSDIVNKEDFTWSAGINFSLDKNKITELTVDEFISGSKLWKVGNSLFDFYIADWAGVDPADGYGMWYVDELDADGNVTGKTTTKVYGEATEYELGSSLPEVLGGFTTNFKYKNFDLNILMNFSYGGKLLDTDYSGLINTFESEGSSTHPDVVNRWQKPGDITNYPLLLASNNDFSSRSSRFLFDNNYVRLKSLTFGYTLPESVTNKIAFKSVRLFIQADNILTWQSHKGIEPEQSFSGLTNNRSPLGKTVSTGAIFKF